MGRRRSRQRKGAAKLYYTCNDFGHLVFAAAEEAEEIDRVRRALEDSKTWGEFRAAMPPKAYRERMSVYFENTGLYAAPDDDEAFKGNEIPGVDDGDYPKWLQGWMDQVLPRDLLERFASMEQSSLNGELWTIDSEHEDALVEELRRRGHEVERRDDLEIY